VNKKKNNKKTSKKNCLACSPDSDPICFSSSMEVSVEPRRNMCDMDGFELELVLTQDSEGHGDSPVSVVPRSSSVRRGAGDSGLFDLVGEELPSDHKVLSLGTLVDKGRGDAFNRECDEDIVRSMQYEGRVRAENMVQVRESGF
jgi:hypothetical protein